jgi:hypothetical protein
MNVEPQQQVESIPTRYEVNWRQPLEQNDEEDYAWPHTTANTGETIWVLKCEIFNCPAYSPVLAPLDYHLFGPLYATFRGHWFADEVQLKEVVHDWLCTQPQKLFLRASESLWNPG